METRRKVLIVDDDENVREVFADALRFEGYVVDTAENGKVAQQTLRSSPGVRWVIILDLMMPEMDGETFLRAQRTDPDLTGIPVVVLTAGGDCRKLKVSLKVADCLPKTVALESLVAAIDACA